jgi:hypothetical protein
VVCAIVGTLCACLALGYQARNSSFSAHTILAPCLFTFSRSKGEENGVLRVMVVLGLVERLEGVLNFLVVAPFKGRVPMFLDVKCGGNGRPGARGLKKRDIGSLNKVTTHPDMPRVLGKSPTNLSGSL